jgi:hypothetical protein
MHIRRIGVRMQIKLFMEEEKEIMMMTNIDALFADQELMSMGIVPVEEIWGLINYCFFLVYSYKYYELLVCNGHMILSTEWQEH